MDTVHELRTRYGRLSDDNLLALLASDASDSLTNDEFRAITEEVVRRGLRRAPPMPPVAVPVGTALRGYPKAPLAPRVIAHVIDFIIAAGPLLVCIIPLFLLLMASRGIGVAAALMIAAALWALYYSFAKDGFTGGQSFGKRAAHLMVVDLATNGPCTIGQSAIRTLVMLGLGLVPVFGWLVEPIAVLADADGRRLGDKAAGTQVIDIASYTF